MRRRSKILTWRADQELAIARRAAALQLLPVEARIHGAPEPSQYDGLDETMAPLLVVSNWEPYTLSRV